MMILTETENGALAYKTSTNACLDLYISLVRGINPDKIANLFALSWNKDPLTTIKIIFNTRDVRNGKGERDVTFHLLILLKKYLPQTYQLNIRDLVANYGRYLDLLEVLELDGSSSSSSSSTPLQLGHPIELEIIVDILRQDLDLMAQNKSVSLCAKWAPSEGLHYDQLAKKIAKMMFPRDKTYLVKYRKEVLSPLRKYLDVVERKMCARQFNQINFSAVPAKAHHLYKKSFLKHTPELYRFYLRKVEQGKAKINSAGLQIHELLHPYINHSHSEPDSTTELQAQAIVKELKSKGTLSGVLAVCDVSGSMSGLPLQVSVSLGILTALLTTGPFHRKLITFSARPELFSMTGETFHQMVGQVNGMHWEMNTDIIAVFKLILDSAILFSMKPDDLPKSIVIFTDMQFDAASSNKSGIKTIYDTITDMYNQAKYPIPKLIFWNLRDSLMALPVTSDVPNTAIVSGFSQQLLKTFMYEPDKFTPLGILESIVAPYQIKLDANESRKKFILD